MISLVMLPSELSAPPTEMVLPTPRSLNVPLADVVIFVDSEKNTIFDPPSRSLMVTLSPSLEMISRIRVLVVRDYRYSYSNASMGFNDAARLAG